MLLNETCHIIHSQPPALNPLPYNAHIISMPTDDHELLTKSIVILKHVFIKNNLQASLNH